MKGRNTDEKEQQSGLAMRRVEDLVLLTQTNRNSESQAERSSQVKMDVKLTLKTKALNERNNNGREAFVHAC